MFHISHPKKLSHGTIKIFSKMSRYLYEITKIQDTKRIFCYDTGHQNKIFSYLL